MAAIKAPVIQNEIHGVFTAGNPIDRPRGTASVCRDLRIMPGYWLRLRGGRKARAEIGSGGTCNQIYSFRQPGYVGAADGHWVKVVYSGSPKWTTFSLLTYAVDPFGVETIATAYDGSYSVSNPAAITLLYDRIFAYNGLGVRGTTESKPPFSTYKSGVLRYAGLDAYCPSGARPSVSFASGTGHNSVSQRVRIYVGLYDSATDHYSNAVYAGDITATGGSGTITVSSLNNLTYAYHSSAELSTLKYVFYATIDGAANNVPYLILDSSLTGPYSVGVASSSASLSITSDYTNGWALDFTKEAPYANLPPRPMKHVTYVNGRVYGILLYGGSGSAVGMPVVYDPEKIRPDFTYVPETYELAGVVWSNSYSDRYSASHPGDPLLCWPLTNFAASPNGDAPTLVHPSQDGNSVLVGTTRAMYYLTEIADGLHEWATISDSHGIVNPQTFVVTRYGQAWIDHNNQLVMLPKGSSQVATLSKNYQTLLSGSVRFCDYVYDPINEIDRVEVFLTDGTTVCHDFAVAGEAYTCSNKNFTAAKTLIDSNAKRHHVLANTAFYTQEAQPEDGLIPTRDENYVGGNIVASDISGEYVRNWDDFGDSTLNKEIDCIEFIGDGALSSAVGGSPITIEAYFDFEEVTSGNKTTALISKTGQASTDSSYRAVISASRAFWCKFVYKISGHSGDSISLQKFASPQTEGDRAYNFYGSIMRLLFQIKRTVNRP